MRVALTAPLRAAPTGRRLAALAIDGSLALPAGAALAAAGETWLVALLGAVAFAAAVRLTWACLADLGSTLGRRALGLRAVFADATPLTRNAALQRELALGVSLGAVFWWGPLLLDRIFLSWFLRRDAGNTSTAPIPHDTGTGTVVARVTDIARVRALAAGDGHPSGFSPVASPTTATQPAQPWPSPAATQPAHLAAAPASTLPSQTAPAPPAVPAAPAAWHMPTVTSLGPEPGARYSGDATERLAAMPFIPATIDPEIAVAWAATVARSGPAVDTLTTPGQGRRFLALGIDLLLIVPISGVGLAGLVRQGPGPSMSGIALVVLAWFVLRPLMIATFSGSIGHHVAGYRILGPRGRRISFGQALTRESTGWGAYFGLSQFFGDGSGSMMANVDLITEGDIDRRWPHDRFADTWPVLARDARPDDPAE